MGLKPNRRCMGQYHNGVFVPSFIWNVPQVCCNFQTTLCMHLVELVLLRLCLQESKCLQHLFPTR